MIDEELTNNPDEEEVDEIEESGDVLRDMIKTLNELPTDVLEQLVSNLDEIEEYNKTHPYDEDDDDYEDEE